MWEAHRVHLIPGVLAFNERSWKLASYSSGLSVISLSTLTWLGIGATTLDTNFNKVTWDGPTPSGGTVTITIAAMVSRDPFDRPLVSQAELRQRPLITEGRLIRGRFPRAVW
jgi:hypothetical protein